MSYAKIDAALFRRSSDLLLKDTALSAFNNTPQHGTFYIHYLCKRFEECGPMFRPLIPVRFIDHSKAFDWFMEVVLVILSHARDNPVFNMESTCHCLRYASLTTGHEATAPDLNHLEKVLIFTTTGWATMLLKPAKMVTSLQLNIFSIHNTDDDTGHEFTAFTRHSIEEQGLRRPMRDFLQSFGPILHIAGLETPNSDNSHQIIRVSELDADFLKTTAGINIAWTDLLPAHLDYDEYTKTLFLFRYPAYCLMNIPGQPNVPMNSIFNSCFPSESPYYSPSVSSTRSSEYMKEIVLSIHLLFAQSKKSRARFRESAAFQGIPKQAQDPLLRLLCREHWPFSDWCYTPKNAYKIERVFPYLKPKLDIIRHAIEAENPRSLFGIWKDKRDTLRWWIFWAVIVIGGLGLLLAAAQVGVSIAQLYVSEHQRLNA